MTLLETEERSKLSKMYEPCEDSVILSALSGMNGEVYVDDRENPTVSVLNVSDYSFIAGNPESINVRKAVEFIDSIHSDDYHIRCVDSGFEKVVEEVYKERLDVYFRFATVRSFDGMDFEKLSKAVDEMKQKYELRLIDKELFEKCKSTEWMRDFVISFDNYEEWEEKGLGVMFLKDGEPVSGSSSYSAYPGGIEIEIVTREDYRRQGLAYAIGAALLLECKKRNLVASWDAAHEKSLALAQKLGYKFLYEYKIYGIRALQK